MINSTGYSTFYTMDSTFKCISCEFRCSSMALLDEHIVNVHLPHPKEDELFYQKKQTKDCSTPIKDTIIKKDHGKTNDELTR